MNECHIKMLVLCANYNVDNVEDKFIQREVSAYIEGLGDKCTFLTEELKEEKMRMTCALVKTVALYESDNNVGFMNAVSKCEKIIRAESGFRHYLGSSKAIEITTVFDALDENLGKGATK